MRGRDAFFVRGHILCGIDGDILFLVPGLDGVSFTTCM
jgi:hypothetical protein